MSVDDMISESEFSALLRIIVEKYESQCKDLSTSNRLAPRVLIGFAGRPGSGKTTAMSLIKRRLEQQLDCDEGVVVVMPMDGYHMYKKELAAMPNAKEAFLRRGAEWTFNPKKLKKDLMRIKYDATTENQNVRAEVKVPSFDHSAGDPTEEDITIPSSARIVLVEGNYLLYKGTKDWSDVCDLFDLRVFLHATSNVCLEHLINRHCAAWNISREEAAIRAGGSDTINGDLVDTTQCNADKVIHLIDVPNLSLNQENKVKRNSLSKNSKI